MDIADKLQLKPGHSIRLVDPPEGLSLDLALSPDDAADALLVFVRSSAELARDATQIVEHARADRLTWVAYPKSGRLDTDLDRDGLAAALRRLGLRPVRQVALDETWSALRFRPA